MTNITLLYEERKIKGFEIAGHSGWGTHGNDILCSSISSVSWFVLSLITDRLEDKYFTFIDGSGYYYLEVSKEQIDLHPSLWHILVQFEKFAVELEHQYPEHVIVLRHEGE